MDMDQIDNVFQKIFDDITKNTNGVKYYQYDTILNLLDMSYRRNFESLGKMDKLLKKNNITIWYNDEKRVSVSDFQRGDRITFKLRNQSINNSLDNGNHSSARIGNETKQSLIGSDNAGTVSIAKCDSKVELYKHQKTAIDCLQQSIIKTNKTPFAGLIVLPTGGGKTLTAAYWLAKNYLDKGKKILWIAHRHELLEQAKQAFCTVLAYKDIFTSKTEFRYRLISGIHDKPVNIKEKDDIIFSSKDSLNQGLEYLEKNWIKKLDEVFLVIDEAHHAVAKTYRKLISNISKNVTHFRMIGLTATPFRTAESEEGLLQKIFYDDIIYKIDMKTLINNGILSKPVFLNHNTDYDMTKTLSEKELNEIKYFDIDKIGSQTAKTIAENAERNGFIVDTYIKNKDKFNQTIIFALNQDNAIALNSLFNHKGIVSDYIISAVSDQVTGATHKMENKQKISRFRNGVTKVLINVNILSEGTDLPKVKTVFLTRPTISPILMTQMIGRGLRGVKAGGTKETYIVSFIDNWHDKVKWVNPEKLFVDENITFNDDPREIEKHIIRLIAINKIEEFAVLTDKIIDSVKKEQIEKLDFIERLPIGFYYFSVLIQNEYSDANGKKYNEAIEKNCDVLVFNNLQQSYTDFINGLDDFFERNHITKNDFLSTFELEILSKQVERDFFYGCEKYPCYLVEDIENILQYYAQKGTPPKFFEFKDRDKFDIRKMAHYIIDADMRDSEEQKYIDENWENNSVDWKAYFGIENKYIFCREIENAKYKIRNPADPFFQREDIIPVDEKELIEIEELSMDTIRAINPQFWKRLSDEVYAKHRDSDGYYESASKKYKSKNKLDFQIDHIIPLSRGGRSILSNLQLLTRKENARKGSNILDY